MNKLEKGFTLFEMLVVIAIIGILLGIMSVSFSGAQARARDSKRIQDMNNLQKALETYYALSGSYPTSTSGNGNLSYNSSVILDSWPNDPKLSVDATIWSYYSSGNSPNNNSSSYCLCAKLENTTNANYRSQCASGSPLTHYCVKNRQ